MIYSLCNQTVTIYNVRRGADGVSYRRTVIRNGAFMEITRGWNTGADGVSARSNCLLVIPQGAGGRFYAPPDEFEGKAGDVSFYTLRPGDKVRRGAGGEISSPAEWAALLPSESDGLMEVRTVAVRRGPDGRTAHIEVN